MNNSLHQCSWIRNVSEVSANASQWPKFSHPCARYKAFAFHTCTKSVWEKVHEFHSLRVHAWFSLHLSLVCSEFAYPLNIRPRACVQCRQCSTRVGLQVTRRCWKIQNRGLIGHTKLPSAGTPSLNLPPYRIASSAGLSRPRPVCIVGEVSGIF